MDFDSPDVEKDFPGLYASENGKNKQSRDSDYSEEEKSCKDLLGKKKEKKDSKKDKGYAALEGESSCEEGTKSPSKTKKSKTSFKLGKDKKDKYLKKDKEAKEKKDDSKKEIKDVKKENKDAEKSKDKTKKKKEPRLLKIKDKKKKCSEQEVADEKPIFGIPLHIAVERNPSHDGIEIPVALRECIDYVEEHGLACEGIYKISGLKSKVRHLKSQYNKREKVYLFEHEPHIVASLIKQFLRDLPEPILTHELAPKFEEAATLKNEQKRIQTFQSLLNDLPSCNRTLLSWIFVHMLHVVSLEKRNKMSIQNVSTALSPALHISHHVLQALFAHSHILFQGVEIKKYIPALEVDSNRLSLELPDSPTAIQEELNKQENVLNNLHAELNTGVRDQEKEEKLWEIQRVVTQLKRKLRFFKQAQCYANSNEQESLTADLKGNVHELSEKLKEEDLSVNCKSNVEPGESEKGVHVAVEEDNLTEKHELVEKIASSPVHLEKSTLCRSSDHLKDGNVTVLNVPPETETVVKSSCLHNDLPVLSHDKHTQEDVDFDALLSEFKLHQITSEELMLLGDELRRKFSSEKREIERLKSEIHEYQLYKYQRYFYDSTENSSSNTEDSDSDEEQMTSVLEDLMKENKFLEAKNLALSKVIQKERETCINIKVQLKLLQLSDQKSDSNYQIQM